MKRLFILSAAVAALASCSNSEVITEVNEPQVPDKAIAFETFSSNATREGAENSGQTKTDGLEEHHNNFQVWGYKDVQPDYVFNRVTVSYTDPTAEVQSGSWNYNPIHFWDKNANSYEFYACAPATASDATSSFTLNQVSETSSQTQANEYFTINNVTLNNVTSKKTDYVHSLKDNQVTNSVNKSGVTSSSSITYGNAGANTDYMIANACKVANTNFGDPVQLLFNHILSRLNITVKKSNALDNYEVALTSLVVKNIQSKGNFDESRQVTDLNQGTTGRWNTQNSPLNYVANSLSSVTTTSQYVLQSLVIPQEVEYEEINRDGTTGSAGNKVSLSNNNKPYIELAYTITSSPYTESFKAYFNLAQAFGSSNDAIAFNEGWQNTLHITIDADVISFTADVYKWADNKTYELNSDTGASSQTSPSGGN